MVRYPHILYHYTTATPTLDGTGDWVVSSLTLATAGVCRAEPNGGGSMVSLPDGELIKYAWSVFAPLDTEDVTAGSRVVIKDGTTTLAEGMLLRAMRRQKHLQLWV